MSNMYYTLMVVSPGAIRRDFVPDLQGMRSSGRLSYCALHDKVAKSAVELYKFELLLLLLISIDEKF